MRFRIIFFIALLPYWLLSQEKRDYIWVFGYTPNDINIQSGGTILDFHDSPVSVYYFNIPFDMRTTSMVSDTGGQLLFYTNGCTVANRHHEPMLNGDSINFGDVFVERCVDFDHGYPTLQGAVTLPWPDSPDLYVILHLRVPNNAVAYLELLYSVVDMRLDNGLGAVVKKNELLYYLPFSFADNLTAVRHGNGRDWWIVAPQFFSDKYYKFLLSPEGLSGPFMQAFGIKWTNMPGGSQACFSPDGSKYIRMARHSGCQIADFDRCTGELSNAVNITFYTDTITAAGCAVSPNNRYLYVAGSRKMFQFDLHAPDIAASRTVIGVWDGAMMPLATTFFQGMLAPDGKIYFTASSSVYMLHVIHNPNEPGLACNLEQHGLELPTMHAFSVPNFPHFRLYESADSPCDTLGISNSAEAPPERAPGPLRILPNPAATGGDIRVEAGDLFGSGAFLHLYDLQGRLLRRIALPEQASVAYLSAGGLSPGVYVVTVSAPGRLQRGRVVVE